MRLAARGALSVVCTLGLAVCVMVLGGASASAEVVHHFEFNFNGSDSASGQFGSSDLGTIAVDQASGDVYVERYESGVVDWFDVSGKSLGQITGGSVPQGSLGLFYYLSGVAVDNSGGPNDGDVYVAGTENDVVYRFDSSGKLLFELNGSGTPAGSFRPGGLAVGATGELYVIDLANNVVDEFDPSGGYVGQIASPQIMAPSSIAVDSSGNVYLTNNGGGGGGNVVKLEPGGGSSVIDANKADAVAVDPVSSHVYVSENHYPSSGVVVEFDASGNRLGAFGEEQISSSVLGLAVHGATGEVYAADNNDRVVDVFGPGVVIPDVLTEAASGVQPTGVTLNGTVNPGGVPVSSCEFEYGTSTSYGQSAPCAQSPGSIGSGTSRVPVSASVTGLSPDTTYHFRLVVANANGTNRGEDVTVTTAGPPRVDGESVSNLEHTTATLEGQVDPSGFETTYRFEYGTSTSYGTSVPIPDVAIGSGMSDVPVSQQISGLQSGVTYHYRVVGTSSQGTVDGPDSTFTTVPPGSIDTVYATDVASGSATIDAQVNPIGANTEYSLEYGTTVSYGHLVSGSTGNATTDVLLSSHLQELASGTIYHYRVVLHNQYGTVEGADHVFTTQTVGGSSLVLPDSRAWELVSPPNKKGALIESTGASDGTIQASSTGDGITYISVGPHVGEDPQGKSVLGQVLSMRGADGWRSQELTLPQGLPEEGEPASGNITYFVNEYTFFSPDLSLAAVEPQTFGTPPLAPGATERTLYVRNDVNSGFMPLVTSANVPSGTKYGGNHGRNGDEIEMHFLAATPDMSHFVFETPLALTPNATREGERWNLYEWSAGQLQLISILPDGVTQPTDGGEHGGVVLAGEGPPHENDPVAGVARAMSNDGHRVAWTWGTPDLNGTFKGLYVRDTVEEKTVRVGGSEAVFQGMNSEGSRVFYLEKGDLYMFTYSTGVSTDLTNAHGTGEANAGVREDVMGTSEDGSSVYFVATGVLANGAVRGEDNLYLARETGGVWVLRYIATLSPEDEKSWYAPSSLADSSIELSLPYVSSRVSPDGRYAAFMSDRSLTGYDNVDAHSGQPDEEVYLYDAVTERLVCASCNPTGARPVGVLDNGIGATPEGNLLVDRRGVWGANGNSTETHWLAGSIPGWDEENNHVGTYQPRYLSDSGRLFFDSPDGLVPTDTNGLEDVYEYEPVGIGDCASASDTFVSRLDGCVSLISSGISRDESMFYDASENGDDAFFITSSKLTEQDYDASFDVYDAHVCSEVAPCATSPVSPPPCTSGDSCKAAPSPQPEIFGPAPSATFSGTGNVVEEPKSVAKRKVKAKAKKHVKRRSRKPKKRKRKIKKSGVVKASVKGNR